jgi:hypothetical protein
LLCATKDQEVVEYALSRTASPALVSEYQTCLPDKKLLQAKLQEFYEQAREQVRYQPSRTTYRLNRERTVRHDCTVQKETDRSGVAVGGDQQRICIRKIAIYSKTPRSIHIWWARRPLAAARAVIFAQMVDDPSSNPDLFPTEKAQEKERKRLFKIIEELVLWENTTNEEVLEKARAEIWQSWRRACAENVEHPQAKELFDRHKLPAFHDQFAGGGALPLEAQRLGLESYASDLTPLPC